MNENSPDAEPTKKEKAEQLRDELTEELLFSRNRSAKENIRESLSGWRNSLQLDNRLVAIINILFLGIGLHLATETSGALFWIGVLLAITGGIGILDAVIGRLMILA